MPNIAVVLKQEITRLAAKQVRLVFGPLRREKVALKRAVRELRRRVKVLETETELLKSEQQRSKKLVLGALPAKELSIRITAKGMRSLRRKLRLTQAEFARLLDVSIPTVWLWEQKKGALRVRDTTRKAIFAIRGIGAREARARLEASKPVAPAKPARRKTKKS